VVHILENDVESEVQNRTDSLHKMAGPLSEVEGNFSTNTGFVHVCVHIEIFGSFV